MPWGDDDEIVQVAPPRSPSFGDDDEIVQTLKDRDPLAWALQNRARPTERIPQEPSTTAGIAELRYTEPPPLTEYDLAAYSGSPELTDFTAGRRVMDEERAAAGMGGALLSGARQGVVGAGRMLARGQEAIAPLIDPNVTFEPEIQAATSELEAMRAGSEAAAEASASPFLHRSISGAARSLIQAIPAGILGGPAGAIGIGVGSAMDDAIEQGQKAGLQGEALRNYVYRTGAIEGGITAFFQKMGMGGLESMFGGKLKGSVLKGAVNELREELAIAYSQLLNDKVTGINPNATSLENIVRTTQDTIGQTLLAYGAAAAPHLAANVTEPAVAETQPRAETQTVPPGGLSEPAAAGPETEVQAVVPPAPPLPETEVARALPDAQVPGSARVQAGPVGIAEGGVRVRDDAEAQAQAQAQAQEEVAAAQTKPAVERRVDLERRRRIAQMSPEELRIALSTDELTGLGSKRAWEDSPKKAVQVLADVDSLKWVNDNWGHEKGNELLKAVGQAMREEGLDAYRLGGDEFAAHFDTQDEAEAARARLQARLATVKLTYESGGKTYEFSPQTTIGAGATLTQADERLLAAKTAREAAGARAPRGARPAGMAEVVTSGRETIGAPAAVAGTGAAQAEGLRSEPSLRGAAEALPGIPQGKVRRGRLQRGGLSRRAGEASERLSRRGVPAGDITKVLKSLSFRGWGLGKIGRASDTELDTALDALKARPELRGEKVTAATQIPRGTEGYLSPEAQAGLAEARAREGNAPATQDVLARGRGRKAPEAGPELETDLEEFAKASGLNWSRMPKDQQAEVREWFFSQRPKPESRPAEAPATPAEAAAVKEYNALAKERGIAGVTQRGKGKVVGLEAVAAQETGPIPEMADVEVLGSLGGGTIAPIVLTGERAQGKSFKHYLRKFFRPGGEFPREAFDRLQMSRGEIEAAGTHAAAAIRTFKEAAAKVFGSKPTAQQQYQVTQALRGEVDLKTLPEGLRDSVSKLRAKIKKLSRELLDSGMVQGDLAATIEKNLDVYLHRSYRVYHDPNWPAKIMPEDRNRAIQHIRSEIQAEEPGLAGRELEDRVSGALNALLNPKADSPMAALHAAKAGAKDLSILKRREDIPVWLRRLWGEEQDPVNNYARTVIKQSALLANHKLLTDLRKMGLGKWLFEKPTGQHYVKIEPSGNWAFSPLDGLHTTPEIFEAWTQLQGSQAVQGAIARGYLKAVAAVKWAKTVGNIPQGAIRNFLGNPQFALAAGHVDPAGGWTAAKTLWAMARSKDGRLLNLAAKLQRHGVLDQDVTVRELNNIVRDARPGEDVIENLILPEKGTKRFVMGAKRGLDWAWSAADNFWKIHGWIAEEKLQRAMHPDWSSEQIDAATADVVRRAYPNYAYVPGVVKALRRTPVMGTFVSFPAEVIRTTGGAFQRTFSELNSNDPKVRAVGARRLAGLLVAGAMPATLAVISRAMSGVDKEDEEDLRRGVAPWEKNATLFWMGRDSDGKPQYVDLSFMFPTQYFEKPLNALMGGGDPAEALGEASREAFQPYLDENIVLTAIVDILRNTKKAGGRVYNPQDLSANIAKDILGHAWKAAQPGAIARVGDLTKALTGQVSEKGRDYNTAVELMALLGFRGRSLDLEQSLLFKAVAFSKDETEAGQILRKKLGSRGNVSVAEIAAARRASETSREALFGQIVADVQAMERQGVSREKIEGALAEGGIGKPEIKRILEQKYERYLPRELPYLDRLAPAVEGAEQAEVKAAIRESLGNALLNLTDPQPVRQKGEAPGHYTARLHEWEASRGQAKDTLVTRGLDTDQLRSLLIERARAKKWDVALFKNGKRSAFGKRLKALELYQP